VTAVDTNTDDDHGKPYISCVKQQIIAIKFQKDDSTHAMLYGSKIQQRCTNMWQLFTCQNILETSDRNGK